MRNWRECPPYTHRDYRGRRSGSVPSNPPRDLVPFIPWFRRYAAGLSHSRPLREVKVGWLSFRSWSAAKGTCLHFRPTCGRTEIDLEGIAAEVEKRPSDFSAHHHCCYGLVVNGPGEARAADSGITEGGVGPVFRHGQILCKVETELVDALVAEANNLLAER